MGETPNRNELNRELNRLHHSIGEVPTPSHITKHSDYTYLDFHRHFSTWQLALQSAGIVESQERTEESSAIDSELQTSIELDRSNNLSEEHSAAPASEPGTTQPRDTDTQRENSKNNTETPTRDSDGENTGTNPSKESSDEPSQSQSVSQLDGKFTESTKRTTDQTDMNVSTAAFAELSGFRRDLLIVIGGLDTPKGLEIKTELEQYYDDTIHHGRLYPNLDTLTEQGLVEKIAVNNRSNGYNLTNLGEAHIQARRQWETDRTSSPDTETANIPTEPGNKTTKHPDTEQPESNEPTNAAPHMRPLPNGRVDTLTVTVLDYDADPESNHVARLQVELQDGTEVPLNIWHDLELDWVVGAKYTIEQAQHNSWEAPTGTNHELNSTSDFRATPTDTPSKISTSDTTPSQASEEPGTSDTKTSGTPNQTELLNAIQHVADTTDRPLKASDVSDATQYSVNDVTRVFGSWQNTLDSADIDNKARLIDDLQRVADKLGHHPTTTEMNNHGHVSATTYAAYFGTYTAAIDEAFDKAEPTRSPTSTDTAGQSNTTNTGSRTNTATNAGTTAQDTADSEEATSGNENTGTDSDDDGILGDIMDDFDEFSDSETE